MARHRVRRVSGGNWSECGEDAKAGRRGVRSSGTHPVGQRILLCGRVGDNTPKGAWTPTVFENELLNLGIHPINSRQYHPQTNGKLERFHRILETEVDLHDSLEDFVTHYNERRLHWSLDIDNHQTPLKVFRDKTAN